MRQKIEDIKLIVIHTFDTPPSFDGGLVECNEWHKERGFKDDNGNGMHCGYHYIIRKDGRIECARPIDRVGAHTAGVNLNSIGIAWVGGANGKDDRTNAQKAAMADLLQSLYKVLPSYGIIVRGHNDFSSKKCPNFNVKKEYWWLTQ